MPIRVYRCSKCGNVEEVIEGRTPEEHLCFDCNVKMKRLQTAANFHLKGSGFYVNDYKSKEKK
jgi:putative FmdB family regulatory protein